VDPNSSAAVVREACTSCSLFPDTSMRKGEVFLSLTNFQGCPSNITLPDDQYFCNISNPQQFPNFLVVTIVILSLISVGVAVWKCKQQSDVVNTDYQRVHEDHNGSLNGSGDTGTSSDNRPVSREMLEMNAGFTKL
jgi:hypothetical protein